jgi:hypothetical protein
MEKYEFNDNMKEISGFGGGIIGALCLMFFTYVFWEVIIYPWAKENVPKLECIKDKNDNKS